MQTSKLKVGEHYAVRRYRGIERFRMVAVMEKDRWTGPRNWITMAAVSSGTGEDSGERSIRIAPKDILAPWEEYREEFERKEAERQGQAQLRHGNEQFFRSLLALYGFDSDNIGDRYRSSRPISLVTNQDPQYCELTISLKHLAEMACVDHPEAAAWIQQRLGAS